MDTKGKSKIYWGLAATFLAVVLFFHPLALTAREGDAIDERAGNSITSLDGYSDVGAKEFASAFLSAKHLQTKNISTIPELALEYKSADTAATKLWFYSDADGGFALVALKGDGYVVAGYSLEGKTVSGEIHSSIKNLLNYFEGLEALNKMEPVAGEKGTVVVAPLLEREGISLNQFSHASVGGCPSGCVATALAQIMCYYKYPFSGTGSTCYLHPVYGELCADFENTVYNWESMTPADYELLSYHVGIATKMNYCGSSDGSAPMDPNYQNVLEKNFRYSVYTGSKELYYIYREIDNERPVYCELPGYPGHAMVLDGYDSDGLLHINFGWGGSYDGYYMLNTNDFMEEVPSLHSNISGIRFISTVPLWTDKTDSLALVAFHNSMGGKTGWDLSKPVIKWPGVMVVNGRVTEIRITNYYLEGTIPSEIGTLTELRRLNIKGLIHSPIPNSITGLTKLKELVINGVESSQKGPMPTNMGNLSLLEELRLTGLLNGQIPASIGNLSNLKILDLSLGDLSGSLPAELYNLTALETLNLSKNELSGTISNAIGGMTNLKYLSLWTNHFEGSLPDGIGNLTQLREFIISVNNFSGEIPGTIGNWTEIDNFSVFDNSFEGALPEGVANFKKLASLNISNNKFTSLPETIGLLSELRTIEANNNLIDSIPSSVSMLSKLFRLSMTNNRLKTIPDLGSMPALWDLQLSNNIISALPEGIGDLTYVKDLYLGNNQLTELPSSIEKLATLRVLSLTGNRLTSVPSSFCFLGNLEELYINNNNINRPLPPLAHLGLNSVDIRNNKLVFSDIASSMLPDDTIFTSADNWEFSYYDQAKVELSDSIFYYGEGDSVAIDIRGLSRLSHPKNSYEWYRGEEMVMEGPVLVIANFTEGDEGQYYCKIRNTKYKKVLVLETYPLELTTGNRPAEGNFITTRETSRSEFSDDVVTLVAPAGLRGEVVWQASEDMVTWHNISAAIDNPSIAGNIVSAEKGKVVVEPQSPLHFRYVATEDNCDPVVSDTVRIVPYGKILLDTVLNVVGKEAVVVADSIEIVVPPDFTEEDFRLTIRKLDDPPAAPDTVVMGSVYDVKVSTGSLFKTPLLIRLKNIDKGGFNVNNIDSYKAVYFDEEDGAWVQYDKSMLSLADTSVIFGTDHLTKLSWWFDAETQWGYTDVYVKNNIKVYYKQKDMNSFIYLYGKSQSPQPWHLAEGDPEYGTPVMVQDVAQYLFEVMNKYREQGLTVPDHEFSVFVKEMDDYGNVGLMGLLNHYMNINRDIDTPEQLRSVLAHEFMHYTQDNYISAHAGNIFWMEAHAHLSDRIVWDETVIPVSESDSYLLDNRTGENNIFKFLSEPWDYWDTNILAQNALGNVNYCYLAGTFLHYMRSYKEGEKLSPTVLLKETPYTESWKEYLDSYIVKYLDSNIGDQYDGFVRYIVGGTNPNFGLLNHKEGEDPIKYLKSASTEFMTDKYYKLGNDLDDNRVKDSIVMDMPYLSSKMVQMFNLNSDHKKVLVKYIRKSPKEEGISTYLGRFDNITNSIILQDISAVDSGFFFIDSPTGDNLVIKKHIAWLLFINKDKAEDHKINYQLDVLAVPEVSFFDSFSFLAGTSLINSPIHVLTDGTNEREGEITVLPVVYRYYGDEIYHSRVTINTSMTETEIVSHSSSDWIEQTFRYNFVTGDMYVYEKENWGGLDDEDPIDIREFTMVLKEVDLIVPIAPGGQSRFIFRTKNTEQTKDVVESMTYTRQFANYDWEKMEHGPITTTTYLRTNYEDLEGNDLDVKLILQFF